MAPAADIYAIAASGMAAQQTEMDLIAANIANATSTQGGHNIPYRARTAVLEPSTTFADALAGAQDSDFDFALAALVGDGTDAAPGVAVSSIAETASNAGEVDPIEEMVRLVAAGRSYDADVSVLQTAKQMDLDAADIARLA